MTKRNLLQKKPGELKKWFRISPQKSQKKKKTAKGQGCRQELGILPEKHGVDVTQPSDHILQIYKNICLCDSCNPAETSESCFFVHFENNGNNAE
jgi:hypothetical protein